MHPINNLIVLTEGTASASTVNVVGGHTVTGVKFVSYSNTLPVQLTIELRLDSVVVYKQTLTTPITRTQLTVPLELKSGNVVEAYCAGTLTSPLHITLTGYRL